MRCRKCGHENAAGANFCSSCGTPLAAAERGASATGDTLITGRLPGDRPGERMPGDRMEDTTVSLSLVEDRAALAAELGDVLDQLPEGTGMLVVRRGPNVGSTFALDRDETTVGRHPDSDIFLDDVTVSRRHAVVSRTDGGYRVADVGSLNGTYVDHEHVEQSDLTDMQELQVGRFVLTFLVGSP